MNDYLFLMYQPPGPIVGDWASYFSRLGSSGQFSGGSSVGEGIRVTRDGTTDVSSGHLVGYIRVSAESLAAARELLPGNPVYEAGGVVEIRELPRDR